MADKSKIEWTNGGSTWNPIIARRKDSGKRGWFCTKPSTGCKHCYAEKMNIRFGTGLDYSVQSLEEINIEIHEKTLTQPLRWKRPRMIFVGSMSDLFHESVSFEMIDRVFAVMALSPRHTFQVLTKRPARMLQYFSRLAHCERWERVRTAAALITRAVQPEWDWPLENVWLGVTCENQQVADERIPHLLQTPAAVRWLICEPLLGEIDLTNIELPREYNISISTPGRINCLTTQDNDHFYSSHNKIDWVVIGGESGRNDKHIRPMHPDWARSLRDQCVAVGVPFFFKQWGEYLPITEIQQRANKKLDFFSLTHDPKVLSFENQSMEFWRVGKKAAGRLLDGREWSEYPFLGEL